MMSVISYVSNADSRRYADRPMHYVVTRGFTWILLSLQTLGRITLYIMGHVSTRGGGAIVRCNIDRPTSDAEKGGLPV